MANHDPSSETRTRADSYITGHKPKETLAELIARCNANSMIGDMPELSKAAKKEKLHKVAVAAATHLTKEQVALVLQLVRGERASLVCDGQTYATLRLDDGSWSICGLSEDSKEYIVIGDQCTCEDSKFRKHECKHVRALRSIA